MFRKLGILFFVILISFGFFGCKLKDNESVTTNGETKLKVIVSFNAMRELAEAVGKDKIQVLTMVPDGVEPHDFEPRPKDMAELEKANVFIYNGIGMENWVDKTISTIENKELITVEASKGCNYIENADKNEIEEHGKYDPHIWLSLKEAKTEALNIKEAFIKADGKNKDYYENNYKEFAAQIDSLYNEYNEKFKRVNNKDFVTGHAAFGYLCRDFNLQQNSVEKVFGEGEPTPNKLKELVEFCRTNKVKTVFAEQMASPKVSETLATEVGAKVQKIYTIESKEDNKDYLSAMKDNLYNIYNSLK